MFIYVDFGDPINDFCEAESFSFGMDVERVAGGPPHRAQRQHFKASFSQKPDELIYRDLWLACAQGDAIASATIEVWRSEKACTLMYTLTDVRIAALDVFSSSKPVNVGLDFAKISHRHFGDPLEW